VDVQDNWIKLAEQNGITSSLFHKRVSLGWSKERAATEKVRDQQRRLTEEEKAYICKFYDWDGPAMLGYALDKNPKVIAAIYSKYQKQGLVNYYKRMWDRQYLKVEESGWF
jgi:hypothetical protein